MWWRGFLLFVCVLLVPFSAHAALTATLASFDVTSGQPVTSLQVDAAAVYTIEYDVIAGSISSSERQLILTNLGARGAFPGGGGNNNIGGVGVLTTAAQGTGNAALITKRFPCNLPGCPGGNPFGSGHPDTFDERAGGAQYASWDPQQNTQYHVKVVFDSIQLKHSFTITGPGGFSIQRTADLHPDAVQAASRGLTVELGLNDQSTTNGEAAPIGWKFRNAVVTASGTAGGNTEPNPVFNYPGVFHTPTQGNEVKRYPLSGFDADDSFSGVKVDIDVTVGPWNTLDPAGLHGIFWLQRGVGQTTWDDNIVGYVNIAASNHRLRTRHDINNPSGTGNNVDANFGPSQGQKYHFSYLYDGAANTVTTTVTDQSGNVVSRTNDVADAATFGAVAAGGGGTGFFIEIGQPAGSVGPEVPTYGWTYSDLNIEFIRVGSSGGPTGQCIDLTKVPRNPVTGPLRLLPGNTRYATADGTTAIYLTGSHTWDNVQDMKPAVIPGANTFDNTAYLALLKANNHNFVRLWMWEDDGAWKPAIPWLKTANGKYDLTQYDPAYIALLKSRIEAAQAQGMYASVMLFQYHTDWATSPFNPANNINGIDGGGDRDSLRSTSNTQALNAQKAYVSYMIDQLNAYDNIIWEVGNEMSAPSTIPWQTAIVNHIKTYEATKPKQHLINVNAGYGGAAGSAQRMTDLKGTGAHSISYIAKNAEPPGPSQSDPSVLTFSDTDHIGGVLSSASPAEKVDWVWRSFTGGAHPIHMEATQNALNPQNIAQGELVYDINNPSFPVARKAMGVTLFYANRIPLARMAPAPSKCSTGQCLVTTSGTPAYLVYVPQGGSFNVDLTGTTGQFDVEWIGPDDGGYLPGSPITGGTNVGLVAPFSGPAAALISQGLTPIPATVLSSSGCAMSGISGRGRADANAQPATPNGEPGNLHFHAGPFTPSATEPALQFAVPPHAEGYPIIMVSMDVKTPATWPTADEVTAPISTFFRLDNGCSGRLLAECSLRTPNTEGGMSKLITQTRGVADVLQGEALYETNAVYHVVAKIDLPASKVTYTVTKGGTAVHELTASLNGEAGNQFKIEHTQEGLLLSVSVPMDNPWYLEGIAEGFTFTNIRIDVPADGGGIIDPNGADLNTDEGRMAFLAANLIAVADGEDYSLDCGPSDEALPMPPDEEAPTCVLVYGEDKNVVFGAFATGEEADEEIIDALNSTLYSAHIRSTDKDACDGYSIVTDEFQECADAIDTVSGVPEMYVYAYKNSLSGAEPVTFIVVSEDGVIDRFDTSFLERVGAFFRDLFGLPVSPEGDLVGTVPGSVQRFHHGYFSSVDGRNVTGTWMDEDLLLVFHRFATDLRNLTPSDGQFLLGNEKQVISVERDNDDPAAVDYWRKLTVALRIGPQDGPPIDGDTCGNGVVGFEEQCEPSLTQDRCSDLGITTEGDPSVICKPDCTLDVSICNPQGAACIDDWIPPAPPVDLSCAGDHVCLCGTALWDAIDGKHVDFEGLPFPEDPHSVFDSGGSENIGVACAAAKYIQEGQSDGGAMEAWWKEYYNYQKTDVPAKFMGREYFSRVYSVNIIGSNYAVLQTSKTYGHTDLTTVSEDWFNTLYAALALSAVDVKTQSATCLGPEVGALSVNEKNAPTVTIPGTRTWPEYVPGGNLNGLFVKTLGRDGEFGPMVRDKFWHGLRLPVEFQYPEKKEMEQININTLPIAAEYLGTTDEEIAALEAFIGMQDQFDQAKWDAIEAMIGDHVPVVPITFLRTKAGSASWWGSWTVECDIATNPQGCPGHNPNGNKPGTYGIKLLKTGEMTCLYPADLVKSAAGGGHSGRNGMDVCASWPTSSRDPYCFSIQDLMASGVIYIAEWNQSGLFLIPQACAWEPIFQQGSYRISVRMNMTTFVPEIMVNNTGNTTLGQTKVYCDDDVDEWHPGPYNASESDTSNDPLYYRHHDSGGIGTDVYRATIRIKAVADGWEIYGENPAGAAGRAGECWQCKDADCTDLAPGSATKIFIPFEGIQCVPMDPLTGLPSGGGGSYGGGSGGPQYRN